MVSPDFIPFESIGNGEKALHFAHANGYPPRAYYPLLNLLGENYRVFAMHMRPLWSNSPAELHDWHCLSDDLAQFLDQEKLASVIGVGHSMGATTTLRLALSKPELFRALVLIDPVLFPPWLIHVWNIVRHLGLAHRLHPLVQRALKRRRVFESRQTMFTNYRLKDIFKDIDDEGLYAYVDSLAKLLPDGNIGLVYTPEWEAQIYITGVGADLPIWQNLQDLTLPVLILRGENTDTFWESTARLAQRKIPTAFIETIPGTSHLLPLEKPLQVNQVIRNFLVT